LRILPKSDQKHYFNAMIVYTSKRKISIMDKYPIPGVGAVIIHNNSILLVKRANEPYKNEWSIPGGKVKWGETLQQAAEREIFEETNIVIKAKEPVYQFEIIDHNNCQFHYVVIDLLATYIRGKPKANSDAKEVKWINLENLNDYNINHETLKLIYRLEI